MQMIRWSLSWLVATAIVTGRTLVLPPVMFDFDLQYVALYFDLVSLSNLTTWRETGFLKYVLKGYSIFFLIFM